MIVYIYEKKTNKKINTFKDVYRISSDKDAFKLHDTDGFKTVNKQGIKLVVYGF